MPPPLFAGITLNYGIICQMSFYDGRALVFTHYKFGITQFFKMDSMLNNIMLASPASIKPGNNDADQKHEPNFFIAKNRFP